MGITIRHDAAAIGATGGGGGGSGRKYDVMLRQQAEQQNQRSRLWENDRERMLDQNQAMNQNVIRQKELDAANERADANWARNQKATADQQKAAATAARSTQRGTIKDGIDSGEFDQSDIDKLNKFLGAEDSILNDPQLSDEQKDSALAENQGRIDSIMQRRRPRQQQGPPPYVQADPKIKADISKLIRDELNASGQEYTDAELFELEEEYYNRRYGVGAQQGGGQAPSPQGGPAMPQGGRAAPAPMAPQGGAAPQAPAEQNWATADGFVPAPDATIIMDSTTGQFMVPTTTGTTVTFRTEGEAKQFLAGNQASTAAPVTPQPPATAAPQAPAPAVPATPLAPDPAAAGGPATQPAAPPQVSTEDWSPWDIKNHGEDSRGFFKGVKPRTGTDIKPYKFSNGHQGFKVLREGGGASTFASRAAAEAFLASGQVAPQPEQQAPQAGAQPPAQAAPPAQPPAGQPPAETPPPQAGAQPPAQAPPPIQPPAETPPPQAGAQPPAQAAPPAQDPPPPEKQVRRFGKKPEQPPDTATKAFQEPKVRDYWVGRAESRIKREYDQKMAEYVDADPGTMTKPEYPPESAIWDMAEGMWTDYNKRGKEPEAPPANAPGTPPAGQPPAVAPPTQPGGQPPVNTQRPANAPPAGPPPADPQRSSLAEREMPKSTRGMDPAKLPGQVYGKSPAPDAKVQVSADGKDVSVMMDNGTPKKFNSRQDAHKFLDDSTVDRLAKELQASSAKPGKSLSWDRAMQSAGDPGSPRQKYYERAQQFAKNKPKHIQDAILTLLTDSSAEDDMRKAADILAIAGIDIFDLEGKEKKKTR
jgi:hypothetical protein